MALAHVEQLAFTYAGEQRPALTDVSLTIEPGEIVLLAGGSGSGKTTLIRALAGLVPHFHGGRFAGRVTVGGHDTRRVRPSELAGIVATVFQDCEEQIVFGGVGAEVAFGLENTGVPPEAIAGRVGEALAAVGAEHLVDRAVGQLSGGEVQRVCLASNLALEPSLLLLDEPTSQLDADGARELLRRLRRLADCDGVAVLLSEQRLALPLTLCDRVVVLEEGAVVLDAVRADAQHWLEEARPAYVTAQPGRPRRAWVREPVCVIEDIRFAYDDGAPVVDGLSLDVHRGEVVALIGPNGIGKTTVAKIAAGLLQPHAGMVTRTGRVALLTQDPGRFLVRERVDEEVSLGARDSRSAAGALAAVGLEGFEARHPRDLSSGERERVALAAVLATEPDLLVLDEPTRGVDPEARRHLAALLREQSPRRATLVVTHDHDLVAAAADRVVDLETRSQRAAA